MRRCAHSRRYSAAGASDGAPDRGRYRLAASVFTQEISPLDPPDTARYLNWAPFRVRPGLTIPNLGYDSNVFAVTDQTAQANPSSKIGDYFI
jgi:hypothetical protein